MLSGNAIDVMCYKKHEAIKNIITPRLYAGGSGYPGLLSLFAGYIAEGYKLIIAPASGDLDLRTSPSGKYLVVWEDLPTGTINITDEKTITGISGVLHESVVVLGVQIDGAGQIIDSYFPVTVNCESVNYQNILSFMYCNLEWENACSMTGVDFFGCTLSSDNYLTLYARNSFLFEYNRVIIDSFILSNVNLSRMEITNCLFESKTTASHINIGENSLNGSTIALKNCLFDCKNAIIIESTGTIFNVEFSNVAVKNALAFVADSGSARPVAGSNSIASNIPVDAIYGANYGFFFAPFSPAKKYFFGESAIDFDNVVGFANFISQTADISRTDEADSRLFGFGQENFYTLKFVNSEVADTVKNGIGGGYYWFIQRRDFESVLFEIGGTKCIFNYEFFEDDSLSEKIDFPSDENFLILANDLTSANDSVFIFYNNTLYPTIFGDVYNGRAYYINACFQIWEPESRSNIRNLFRDYETQRGVQNSPMSGQIRFNNLDREVLIRV